MALDALIRIEEGARANVAVPELLAHSDLEPRDRNLVTELVYGACRMKRACDYLADRHRRGPVDSEVRAALRLGVYQLSWTRIPPHAAVSATVEEVKGRGRTVVNAVLRRVASDLSRGLVTWPDQATRLSYPGWIVDRLVRDLGEESAMAALETMNQAATATVRLDGYIQDEGSQMVTAHLAPWAGSLVADVCAAPGGKATGLASVGVGAGTVMASDLAPDRAALIRDNVDRLNLSNVSVLVADAAAAPYRPGRFDLVVVDAPCSGLGVLRRRPDARWRIQPRDVERLAGLQRRLLSQSMTLVRPGGVLAYSVCTLTAEETGRIDKWLMGEAPDWTPIPPPDDPWRPAGRGGLLLPQAAGTDGMFLVALRNPG